MKLEGQSFGWFLICPFCKMHKRLQANMCHNCGATVKVIWEKEDEVISPELMLVR